MVPTTTLHEAEVARLADRLGLELVRSEAERAPTLAAQRYQLVAAETRSPVYPGGAAAGDATGPTTGSTLADLQDWLGLPWE